MKALISVLVLVASQNVFAASVCVIYASYNFQTNVTCDGKSVDVPELNFKGATLEMKKLLEKGYRLVGTNAREESVLYTLIHD